MIDLHAHTTYSDGTLSPTQLVERARDIGLSAVAVTDHDTVDGLAEALAAGERLGVEVVPGVELGVEYGERTLHLLGYFLCELPTEELRGQLAELRHYRDVRNERILERLAAIGYPVAPHEVEQIADGGAVGRPHIGEAMRRRGYVGSIAEAFDRFLRRGAPAYIDRRRLALGAAVRVLRQSGGIGVLAHPGLIPIDAKGLERIAVEAAAAGVQGFECYYSEYATDTVALCLAIAGHAGLVATGGSDFHGSVKPGVHLGAGPGGAPIADEVLVALKQRYRETLGEPCR